jgi:hypothetical protein
VSGRDATDAELEAAMQTISRIEDDPDRLRGAADYLEKALDVKQSGARRG